ncbi:MAG: aldehyde dehydrogenase family protein [Thermoleophilaceae bacterium]
MTELKVGDPLQESTQMGPLISESQRESVSSYLDDGAPVAAQGSAPEGEGFWFPPTVLGPVSNDDRAAREEIFGPVACVIAFDDEADAVRQANDTIYGLSGSVWTRDGARALRMARAMDSGRGVHQLEHLGAGDHAVRRHEAVGRGPRARPRRARALHRREERVLRDTRGLTWAGSRARCA